MQLGRMAKRDCPLRQQDAVEKSSTPCVDCRAGAVKGAHPPRTGK